VYPPHDSCIYCGQRAEPLSREHIIPYALGGQLTLPRASCTEHAAITSQVEREVAQMAYGYARAVAGAPTRRKGKHARTLARRIEVTGLTIEGMEASALVPIAELPPYDFTLLLPPPGILRGEEPDAPGHPRMEFHIPESNPLHRLRKRLGWKEVNTPVMSFPITGFMRMLAKIGHAFATAELRPEKYSPELCPFILGDMARTWYYVGGFDPPQAQSRTSLSYRLEECAERTLVIVDVSLHVLPRLPRYQVVCGSYLT